MTFRLEVNREIGFRGDTLFAWILIPRHRADIGMIAVEKEREELRKGNGFSESLYVCWNGQVQ